MQWIITNLDTIALIVTGIISVASMIAKITPNETDNKYVAIAQRGIDMLAMTTGKTKLKGGLNIR